MEKKKKNTGTSKKKNTGTSNIWKKENTGKKIRGHSISGKNN